MKTGVGKETTAVTVTVTVRATVLFSLVLVLALVWIRLATIARCTTGTLMYLLCCVYMYIVICCVFRAHCFDFELYGIDYSSSGME